ncbi:protease inhibitor I42 family protein [Mucilaginibacter sp.]
MNGIKTSLLLVLIIAIISCKKDNNSKPVIKLTSADSGKALSATQGQKINITLSNPGDGGYVFNTWQYDSSILQLNSHTHINPTNTTIVGDFGSDVWLFTALNSGKSALSITVSRGVSKTQTVQ